jgi:hypothetical protein
MGQPDTIQLTNCYDGPYSLWCTDNSPLLAIIVKYGVARRGIFIHDVDGWKNLQNRHPSLRKETHLENDVEVGLS